MKKILLGLVFALFALQANAATMSISNVSNDSGGVGNMFVSPDSDSLVSGHASITDAGAFQVIWGFVADGDITALSLTTLNPGITIESLIIVEVGVGVIDAIASVGDTLELTLTTLLSAGTDYLFVVTGDALAANTSLDLTVQAVPLPAAVWLFGSALMGLVGVSRRKSTAVAA